MALQASIWTVWRFTSIQVPISHLGQHTEITLQDIPNSRYKLELFVGSEAIELVRKDNRTWVPAQRAYVLVSSQRLLSEPCAYVERFLREPRSA